MHVSEEVLAGRVESSINFGIDQSLYVAGDLTSKANAKSVVDTANAKLHVSQRTFGVRAKAGLDLVDNYSAGFTSGSSLANKDAILPNISCRNFHLFL